jgi:hypothetical protein
LKRKLPGKTPLGRKAPERKAIDHKAAAKRAALNALKRARRTVERAGVKLSEWEGEFLGSVEARVETFGRAFGDPDKGQPGQALSTLQTVKLKEIAAKAKGGDKDARHGGEGDKPRWGRKPFRTKT